MLIYILFEIIHQSISVVFLPYDNCSVLHVVEIKIICKQKCGSPYLAS